MIAERDAQILVHGEHAFHHAGQNGFAARAFQLQAFHQFADAGRGALQRARQQAQVVVTGRQRLIENGRVQQALGVSADLRYAAGKGSRKEKRQNARQHQHRQRDAQQWTP